MPGKTRLQQVGACRGIAATMLLVLPALTPTATAGVAQLNITSTATAFNGAEFGANGSTSVGTYEVITGTFIGKVDPDDPHNSVIVDIENGPRNPDGTVSYSADFQIIRPTNRKAARSSASPCRWRQTRAVRRSPARPPRNSSST